MTRFSWASFLIAAGRYAEWIDRGRPAPEHRQWAEYLQWVASQCGAGIHFHLGEVTHIAIAGERWQITYDGGTPQTLLADGLVLTGPGQASAPAAWPASSRVMTAETFWQHDPDLNGLDGATIAIVGNGETAAGVALGLLPQRHRLQQLDVISPTGMAYTRGEGFRENHMYSDPIQGNWQQLTPEHRQDFIYRTDRGVFSQQALRLLDQQGGVELVLGHLQDLTLDTAGRPVLSLTYAEQHWQQAYDYVVLATGATHLQLFQGLADGATQAEVLAHTGLPALEADAVAAMIQHDLSVLGLTPKLHLPMLAGLNQGPGFPNLSCLGLLADRILEPYAQPPQTDDIPASQVLAPAAR